jgi:O-antigen ligase
MAHGDLAQLAAVLGALGTPLVLLGRGRLPLLSGFALLAAAQAGLALALVPAHDLRHLRSPLVLAGLVVFGGAVAALALALARRPALVPPVLLLAAPFRLPVDLGSQHAFLLLPLYAVLAAAVLALLGRAVRGAPMPALPRLLGVPAAAYISLAAVSLLWSRDLQQGSIELVFFLFPFAALIAVVARAPLARWLSRALAALLVALSALFAVVGLWQAWTHRIFFGHDLQVANVYTSFFRVTSFFKDPSLYGRYLVFGIAVLLVALWLGRLHAAIVAVLTGLLLAGLYFSYSQSAMVTLFVVAVAVTLVLADRRSRITVAAACVGLALIGAAFVGATVKDSSARLTTSGRSRLVAVTWPVFRNHPLAGVGVGAQPLASREEEAKHTKASRNASHTTPLTVAAELGVVGLAAYLALLLGAARLLATAAGRDRALGFGLAAVFLTLFVHSMVYAGFFEDPLTWGSLALAAAAVAAPRAAPGREIGLASEAADQRTEERRAAVTAG